MKRKHPEQTLQIQVANYLRVALRPPTIWTAIGHGGGGKVRGAILKAMGVQPGWPDILIIHPLPELVYHAVLGIELKSTKGKQSPDQHAVMEGFQNATCDYKICRSINDVALALVHAGVPLYARLG